MLIDEVTRRDDEAVAEHDHLTQRHVLVFVHNGGDDIRAARAAVMREADGQPDTLKHRTQHYGHEGLVLHQTGQLVRHRVFGKALHQPHEER